MDREMAENSKENKGRGMKKERREEKLSRAKILGTGLFQIAKGR